MPQVSPHPPAAPMPHRPLLGLTVLAVEDSRLACEALRLICLRSGARIRRADSLRAARRHLQVYRPSVMIVDAGLPDGSGIDLIAEMHRAQPRIDVILASSGDPALEAAAAAAGADGFLAKPLDRLAGVQQAILAHLPAGRQPQGLRAVQDEPIRPDMLAYRDDIALVADMLGALPDTAPSPYAVQFLSSVAETAQDTPIIVALHDLARAHGGGDGARKCLARLRRLVRQRLEGQVAI